MVNYPESQSIRSAAAPSGTHMEIKSLVAAELGIPTSPHARESELEELNKAIAGKERNSSDNQSESFVQKTPEIGRNVLVANISACLDKQPDQRESTKASLGHNSKGVTLSVEGKSSSKKQHSFVSTTPSRKSPRLALLSSGKDVSKALNDGKSSSTAFVVSPTASKTPGASNAVSISSGRKSVPASNGKTVKSTITWK